MERLGLPSREQSGHGHAKGVLSGWVGCVRLVMFTFHCEKSSGLSPGDFCFLGVCHLFYVSFCFLGVAGHSDGYALRDCLFLLLEGA